MTLQQSLFKGEICSIELPSENGPCEILDKHAPFSLGLRQGQIRVRPLQGDEIIFDVLSGIGVVTNTTSHVCVEI